MINEEKNTSGSNEAQRQSSDLPATEVASNPNPRANENIRERSAQPDTTTQGASKGVGSEITDGEDA